MWQETSLSPHGVLTRFRVTITVLDFAVSGRRRASGPSQSHRGTGVLGLIFFYFNNTSKSFSSKVEICLNTPADSELSVALRKSPVFIHNKPKSSRFRYRLNHGSSTSSLDPRPLTMTLPPGDPRRTYNGNIYFYGFCSLNRSPLYLQRNLRRVLHNHRKGLAWHRERSKMRGAHAEENNVSRAEAHQGDGMVKKKWSLQEVQDILARKAFNPQSPFLRIEVTDIKDKLAQFRDLEVPRTPIAKRIKIPSVRANCSCTIWRKAGETVVEQLRGCEIQSKTLPTGERWASIKLDSPFEVPIAQLQPDPDRPAPLGEAPSFSMELKLLAANLHDAWPPIDLKRVPAPKVAYFYDEADLVRLPILIAKWPRLPDIPRTPKECLLEMKAYQTSPSDQTKWVEYTPKLGIIVDIDWFENPSPLQQANGETRGASPRRSHYSPEPKMEIVGHTEWVFEGLLEKVPVRRYPAYHCPFCPLRHSAKQNQMRRFGGADEFCLHLRNNHSALRWEYIPKYSLTDGSGQISHDGRINIRPCREYDELARGTRGTDPRELDWIRPKHPLDIEAFLRGDESWLGKKKRTTNLVASPRHSDAPRSRGGDMAREVIRRRAPEQIPDIPHRPRRTFPVPAAPGGVQFYRNITKRVLREGEEVSESDDDIDEEWLLQKHADTIDSFTDMTKEEKEFIIRFDRHMLREDIASDLHANEALIRFCRANRRWLRRDDMRQEFMKKVASLKIQGAVPSKIIWACTEIINDASEPVKEEDTLGEGGTAPLKTNYGADPVEKGHIYGRCRVCQSMIRDPRKLIRCTNPVGFDFSQRTPRCQLT
jgi:VEFS-Box of polycomb protein